MSKEAIVLECDEGGLVLVARQVELCVSLSAAGADSLSVLSKPAVRPSTFRFLRPLPSVSPVRTVAWQIPPSAPWLIVPPVRAALTRAVAASALDPSPLSLASWTNSSS